MVENGYLVQERSRHDKRSIRVKLSNKGKKLNKAIEALYEKHVENLKKSSMTDDNLVDLNNLLKELEKFWTGETGKGNLT